MSKKYGRRTRKQPRAWGLWVMILIGGGVIVSMYVSAMMRGSHLRAPLPTFAGLIDADGQTLGSGAFAHRYKLVFFGFTQCGAVCPMTLVKVRSVLGAVGTRSDEIAPLFVSLDPEHDKPRVLKDYTNAIDSRIVGVTGDPKRVDSLAQAYGVIVVNRPDVHGAPDLDHSALLYLVDPQDHLVSEYGPDETVSEIASDLERRVRG